MSKYPDHQVQALAKAISQADGAPSEYQPTEGGGYRKYAIAALHHLGIEPELPPTITVTVELSREKAEIWAHIHNGYEGITGTIAAAIQDALQ